MKNHELLNLIGEVNEDYVLEAGNNVVRPRFRWGTLAVCAACAALVVAAYPAYRMSRPQSPDSVSKPGGTEAVQDSEHPVLHEYTLVEGGVMATLEGAKTPAGGGIDVPGQDAPVPEPAQPPRGDGPSDISGGAYVSGAPAQEYASDQYNKLLRGMGMQGEGAALYPDWFAGAWIDWETLRVAIVDSLRTPELESQIEGWCGSGVVFQSAKYSHNFLDSLMEPVTKALDGTGLACGIGVDVIANCLGADLYSGGAAIPDGVLAELARLDPAGDAIRVRVFTQSMTTLTDEIKKGPVPGGKTEPVFDGARAEPNVEPAPTPVEDSEWSIPAEEPVEIDELPENKYDALKEADAQLPEEYDIIEGE